MSDRFLPDKAIDAMDDAGSRAIHHHGWYQTRLLTLFRSYENVCRKNSVEDIYEHYSRKQLLDDEKRIKGIDAQEEQKKRKKENRVTGEQLISLTSSQ